MNSYAKIVAEVLLIVGVHVQLSLLAIDTLPNECSVSALAAFRNPRLDQSTETILEGVKEDVVQQSAESDRASENVSVLSLEEIRSPL